MNYNDYLQAAKNCSDPAQADELIKAVENDCTISDRQFYHIRRVAISAAYEE